MFEHSEALAPKHHAGNVNRQYDALLVPERSKGVNAKLE